LRGGPSLGRKRPRRAATSDGMSDAAAHKLVPDYAESEALDCRRTTRAGASVCLLGITAQKPSRLEAELLWLGCCLSHTGVPETTAVSWSHFTPLASAPDRRGFLCSKRPSGLHLRALRAGVDYRLTSLGLDVLLSKECHARCHVAAASPRAFPPRLQGRPKGRLFLFWGSLGLLRFPRHLGFPAALEHTPYGSLVLKRVWHLAGAGRGATDTNF
jgi:hypothetical protein